MVCSRSHTLKGRQAFVIGWNRLYHWVTSRVPNSKYDAFIFTINVFLVTFNISTISLPLKFYFGLQLLTMCIMSTHTVTRTRVHVPRHTFRASTFSTCRSACPAGGNTLSGLIKSWSSLCPWAEIGDYSGPPCQIYRGPEHSADWICDSCHAECLLVAHLYSHRCLDDLLIKYCSPALRTCVSSEVFCTRSDPLPAKDYV